MIDFGEHTSEKKHLDLTPMIDVVFLLLIFFLLTSIFSKPSIPLDLPRADSARQTGEPAVSVAVKRDGTILLDGAPVAREALQGALAERYGRGGKKELSLVSDRGVPFGQVVEVMDLARKAGAESIAVVAERKR